MAKWTSILRRMPDASEIVLIYVPAVSDPICLAYLDDDDLTTWRYRSGLCVSNLVTHWMPLPQPPEAMQ